MEHLRANEMEDILLTLQKTFDGFLSGIRHVKIEEQWLTGDVRPGRESEQWLNLILRKV